MEYTLSAAGLRVHYFDTAPEAGESRERQILLLLHGWGGCKETFAPVIAALGERYRLLVPDLPGCGRTAEPERPWSTGDYADFLAAFLAALGLQGRRLNACGHSHGGRILIKWSARRPRELSKLVLVDAAGLKPERSWGWYARVCVFKAGKKLLSLPGLRGFLAPWAERLAAASGSADYRQASPLMKRTMVLQLEEDLAPALPLIAVPVLLFWGRDDSATPLYQGRQMEKLIPDAGLVVLEPAGHYSYLDQLPTFLAVLTYFLEH